MKKLINKRNFTAAICALLFVTGVASENSLPTANTTNQLPQQLQLNKASGEKYNIALPKMKRNPVMLRSLSAPVAASTLATTADNPTYTGNSWTYWAENNRMRLLFEIRRSGYDLGWVFKHDGYEANTSYWENYAVWFDGSIHYGEHLGEDSVVKKFGGEKNDPDNTCIVRMNQKVEVERKIQIAPENGTYFKICYKLTNITDQPLEDVRFFEVVDFDIPTGDPGNDIGWYDPRTDFVWVKDEYWFQNGFTGNKKSDHHSVNNYSYVIWEDANDGTLNDNNESNYNDPGIGLQWNVGTLQPGQSWDIDITFWFGQPNDLFAVIGPDRTIHAGQQIQFDASESNASESTIVSYEWDMDGDGKFDDATGVNPVYTYETPGIYNAVLRVTDDKDSQAYDTCKITVLPAMFQSVKVRSFSSLTGLALDPASILGSPFTLIQENGENKIEWNIGSMNVGDKKTLSFVVEVLDPVLGERRMVERDNITNYLDNTANAKDTTSTPVDPTPVELSLGPAFVDVISGFGISVKADKDEYVSPETATVTTSVSLPEYTGEKAVTTQDEFNTCGLVNLDSATNPGSVMLVKNSEGNYGQQGQLSFIVEAPSSAKWQKVYWDAQKFSDLDISVKTRSAATRSALSSQQFSEALTTSGSVITSEKSLFLEVQVTLKTFDPAKTPVLNDLRVTYTTEDFRVNVKILDQSGKQVSQLATYPITDSDYGKTLSYANAWATNQATSGDYRAYAEIVNFRKNNEIVQSAQDAFKILEQSAATIVKSSITTDKMEYTADETVTITSNVMNESTNDSVKSLTVDVAITAPDGTTSVKTYNYSIAEIVKGAHNSRALALTVTRDMVAGQYTVTQSVKMNGTEVSTATATFTVVDSVVQGKGITGTVMPNPLSVKRRIGDLNLLATALNTGNVDLSNVTFRVRIYDSAAQNVIKEFSEVGQLPKTGAGYSKDHPYGAKVELMPGVYPVTLTAEFTYNGEQQVIPLDTRGFVVTNTPPAVNAGSNQILEATSPDKNVINLVGSGTTDENSTDAALKNDIVSYEWKLGNTVLGTTENLAVQLGLGTYTITLTATDTCGATGTATVQIVLRDTVPPVITNLTPSHETITKELALGATVTDGCSGINYQTLDFKSGENALTVSYDTATGRVTSSLPADAADGWYNLSLSVKDYANNSATTPEWKVGLDRTPPVISDLAPEADVFTNNVKPTISATVTDAFAGVDPATVKVSIGSTVLESTYEAATGKVTAVVPTDLADGWHDAKVEVADKVGNTATATWRVGVDLTPPTITNMIPVADSEINQASQEISATVTDALSGVKADTIVLKLDNVIVAHSYDPATGKVVFNAENLTSGIHAVNITVSDNAGNESNATWQFNVQLRVPGSEYLLFHNSQNGQLDISGGNKTINGMAHSHANIKVRGNNTTIIGSTTAVGTISVNGSGHNIALQQSNAEAIPMPVYPYEYYVANATYTYNGGKTFGKGETIPDGIHLVNGDVTVQGDINANITIVATGSISVKSKTVNLTYADTKYKVALYSKDGNISFTSNGVTVKGVIYAPSGECKVASSTSSFTGAIVGNTVDISGQDMTLNPLDYGTENNGGAQ